MTILKKLQIGVSFLVVINKAPARFLKGAKKSKITEYGNNLQISCNCDFLSSFLLKSSQTLNNETV